MKNKELFYTIIYIIFYVISNSIVLNNYGQISIQSLLVNTVITVTLISTIISTKKTKYYGLIKVNKPKKYLYFIPLILLVLINFIGGIKIINTPKEIVLFVLTMLEVGFIEEILFRGFLFKTIEKDDQKTAIVITSLTFGIGHIVNLLNGANFIPTLVQIIYSVSVGYLFVKILIKTKSLWPCIITHSLLNALSIFSNQTTTIFYISSILMLIISISYSFYLNKK